MKGVAQAEESFANSNMVTISELLFQSDYHYFTQKCELYGMPKNDEIFDVLSCIEWTIKFKLCYPYILDPYQLALKYLSVKYRHSAFIENVTADSKFK